MKDESYLGTDLTVVPYLAAHDAAEIDLVARPRPRSGIRAEVDARFTGAREAFDLGVHRGRDNLAQALVLRLLTPVGSLAALGHAAYGSRLGELIGRRKTESLRNLCRAFVLEAVAQEPRVEPKAVELRFDLASESHDSFAFTLAVQPVRGGTPVQLGLEVAL